MQQKGSVKKGLWKIGGEVKRGVKIQNIGNGNYICTVHYFSCSSEIQKCFMHLEIKPNSGNGDDDSNQKRARFLTMI